MDVGKRLPCGHIYHSSCLQVWLQQQQVFYYLLKSFVVVDSAIFKVAYLSF